MFGFCFFKWEQFSQDQKQCIICSSPSWKHLSDCTISESHRGNTLPELSDEQVQLVSLNLGINFITTKDDLDNHTEWMKSFG